MSKPRIILGELKTNKPLEVVKKEFEDQNLTDLDIQNMMIAFRLFDGLTVKLSLWAHDTSNYHLIGWDTSIDSIMMTAMYHMEQLSYIGIYLDNYEQFKKEWMLGQFEPFGVLTFPIEDVVEIEVLQES